MPLNHRLHLLQQRNKSIILWPHFSMDC